MPSAKIICWRRGWTDRCQCGRRTTKLCDFALRGAMAGKTCDKPLCDRCATRVGPNLDYCPSHTKMMEPGKKSMIFSDDLDLQSSATHWSVTTFGHESTFDIPTRYIAFGEESLELMQALGCSKEKAHELVDFVFDRPVGETFQEVGGVMMTLAVLCSAVKANLDVAARTELLRVWKKIPEIRAKQAEKNGNYILESLGGNR